MEKELIKKQLRKSFDAATLEKIARQIVCCMLSGTAHPQLLKLGIIRRSRSVKYPIVSTEYGDIILSMTKSGRAFLDLGKTK